MAATLMDGKALSAAVIDSLAQTVREKGLNPCLATVLVGEDEASASYVRMKAAACEKIGGAFRLEKLPETASTADVIACIRALGGDAAVNGILLQLPLPPQVSMGECLQAIPLAKDVDGLHPQHLAAIFARQPGFVPATARGVMELLSHYGVPLEGRRALVIGRSVEVGIPVAGLLLAANATVTLAHSKTQNLAEICRECDVVVASAGRIGLVTKEMVKPGAAVVDVGTNFVERDGKRRVVGDVDAGVAGVAAFLSPVPGGAGPMTVASLMQNLVDACSR